MHALRMSLSTNVEAVRFDGYNLHDRMTLFTISFGRKCNHNSEIESNEQTILHIGDASCKCQFTDVPLCDRIGSTSLLPEMT